MEYYCSVCDYNTLFNKVFNKHLVTKKHLKRSNDTFSIKMRYTGYYKYMCEPCNYKSNLRTHYNRHLTSNLHKISTYKDKIKKQSGPIKSDILLSSLFLD